MMRGVATTGPNVGAARDLDPAAVAAAYQSWAPALHRWLSVLLGDQGAARTLTGTVFADAVARLGSFDGPDELLAAWPFLVARDHLPARPPPTAGRTGNQRLDAIWLLPAAEREVLLLRLVAGLSAAETGFATGRSARAVRQLVHRGLARLADLGREDA
jgi:DNA-directed RNA polymerase specialized sigma24 family protein